MKLNWMVPALAAIALTLPVSVYADDINNAATPSAAHKKHYVHRQNRQANVAAAIPGDISDKWAGTYSSREINFVTVKRLTFSKEKDGSLSVQGPLVGFPEEVSIGDAVAEPYADRNNKNNPDTMLASFSSDKYKPWMVISEGGMNGTHLNFVQFTCYMKDVDGSRVHISGTLMREP
jgi:hypothetical protein